MVVDVQKTPRTPILADRYGCYLNKAPLCTRKEMVQRFILFAFIEIMIFSA